MTVSAEDVRVAQVLTGTTLALFLMAGFVPGLRPHAAPIRLAIVLLYVAAAAGFMVYLLVR